MQQLVGTECNSSLIFGNFCLIITVVPVKMPGQFFIFKEHNVFLMKAETPRFRNTRFQLLSKIKIFFQELQSTNANSVPGQHLEPQECSSRRASGILSMLWSEAKGSRDEKTIICATYSLVTIRSTGRGQAGAAAYSKHWTNIKRKSTKSLPLMEQTR